jgi:hypothetical protein
VLSHLSRLYDTPEKKGALVGGVSATLLMTILQYTGELDTIEGLNDLQGAAHYFALVGLNLAVMLSAGLVGGVAVKAVSYCRFFQSAETGNDEETPILDAQPPGLQLWLQHLSPNR